MPYIANGRGNVMGDRTPQGRWAKGNAASRTHAAYTYLATGKLPRGCRTIRRQLTEFRRALVRQVCGAENGTLTAAQADTISTAVAHEARRRLLGKWLAERADGMTPDLLIRFTFEIGQATEARSRAVRRLLGGQPGKPRVVDPVAYWRAQEEARRAREASGGPEAGKATLNAAEANLGGFVDASGAASDLADK
jgi:hypothetical protein